MLFFSNCYKSMHVHCSLPFSWWKSDECRTWYLIILANSSLNFFIFAPSGHPWISFYTEPLLKTPTLEPMKNLLRLTSRQLTSTHGAESERKRIIYEDSLSDDSTPTLASSNSCEGEDSGLVDILAVAISRVRISEPKRSRICSPSRPIQQECSSNLKTSNLCTAFWSSPLAADTSRSFKRCWDGNNLWRLDPNKMDPLMVEDWWPNFSCT